MSKKSNFPLLTLSSKRAREITPNELGSHFLHFWPLSENFPSIEDFSIFGHLDKISTKKKSAAREANRDTLKKIRKKKLTLEAFSRHI